MSIVIVQDEIVHYEVLGRGKPLIFLHGWVGSWRYWIPAMQAASVSFRAYAIDLWGFGDSAKRPGLYGLEQQVGMLEAFMQEMGIGKIALIGHGMGAAAAMLYAQRNTRWVDRMMAVAMPNGRHSLNPRLLSLSNDELAEWLAGRGAEGQAVRSEAMKTDPRAVQASLAALQQLDTAAFTEAASTPCLLVYGQNDPAVEPAPAAERAPIGERAPDLPEHVHQVVFEASGHFPMLDETNKFNRLTADFLSLNSGESPRQLQLKEEWRRRVR